MVNDRNQVVGKAGPCCYDIVQRASLSLRRELEVDAAVGCINKPL